MASTGTPGVDPSPQARAILARVGHRGASARRGVGRAVSRLDGLGGEPGALLGAGPSGARRAAADPHRDALLDRLGERVSGYDAWVDARLGGGPGAAFAVRPLLGIAQFSGDALSYLDGTEPEAPEVWEEESPYVPRLTPGRGLQLGLRNPGASAPTAAKAGASAAGRGPRSAARGVGRSLPRAARALDRARGRVRGRDVRGAADPAVAGRLQQLTRSLADAARVLRGPRRAALQDLLLGAAQLEPTEQVEVLDAAWSQLGGTLGALQRLDDGATPVRASQASAGATADRTAAGASGVRRAAPLRAARHRGTSSWRPQRWAPAASGRGRPATARRHAEERVALAAGAPVRDRSAALPVPPPSFDADVLGARGTRRRPAGVSTPATTLPGATPDPIDGAALADGPRAGEATAAPAATRPTTPVGGLEGPLRRAADRWIPPAMPREAAATPSTGGAARVPTSRGGDAPQGATGSGATGSARVEAGGLDGRGLLARRSLGGAARGSLLPRGLGEVLARRAVAVAQARAVVDRGALVARDVPGALGGGPGGLRSPDADPGATVASRVARGARSRGARSGLRAPSPTYAVPPEPLAEGLTEGQVPAAPSGLAGRAATTDATRTPPGHPARPASASRAPALRPTERAWVRGGTDLATPDAGVARPRPVAGAFDGAATTDAVRAEASAGPTTRGPRAPSAQGARQVLGAARATAAARARGAAVEPHTALGRAASVGPAGSTGAVPAAGPAGRPGDPLEPGAALAPRRARRATGARASMLPRPVVQLVHPTGSADAAPISEGPGRAPSDTLGGGRREAVPSAVKRWALAQGVPLSALTATAGVRVPSTVSPTPPAQADRVARQLGRDGTSSSAAAREARVDGLGFERAVPAPLGWLRSPTGRAADAAPGAPGGTLGRGLAPAARAVLTPAPGLDGLLARGGSSGAAARPADRAHPADGSAPADRADRAERRPALDADRRVDLGTRALPGVAEPVLAEAAGALDDLADRPLEPDGRVAGGRGGLAGAFERAALADPRLDPRAGGWRDDLAGRVADDRRSARGARVDDPLSADRAGGDDPLSADAAGDDGLRSRSGATLAERVLRGRADDALGDDGHGAGAQGTEALLARGPGGRPMRRVLGADDLGLPRPDAAPGSVGVDDPGATGGLAGNRDGVLGRAGRAPGATGPRRASSRRRATRGPRTRILRVAGRDAQGADAGMRARRARLDALLPRLAPPAAAEAGVDPTHRRARAASSQDGAGAWDAAAERVGPARRSPARGGVRRPRHLQRLDGLVVLDADAAGPRDDADDVLGQAGVGPEASFPARPGASGARGLARASARLDDDVRALRDVLEPERRLSAAVGRSTAEQAYLLDGRRLDGPGSGRPLRGGAASDGGVARVGPVAPATVLPDRALPEGTTGAEAGGVPGGAGATGAPSSAGARPRDGVAAGRRAVAGRPALGRTPSSASAGVGPSAGAPGRSGVARRAAQVAAEGVLPGRDALSAGSDADEGLGSDVPDTARDRGFQRALQRAGTPEALIAEVARRPEAARRLSAALPEPAARLVREITRMRTLPEAQQALLESRGQAPSAVDAPQRRREARQERVIEAARVVRGHRAPSAASAPKGGERRMMKLSQKLLGLIHLAEAERRQDEASRRVRRASEKVDTSGDAGTSSRGVDGVTLSSLQREVLEAVLRELDQTRDRREGGSHVDVWW